MIIVVLLIVALTYWAVITATTVPDASFGAKVWNSVVVVIFTVLVSELLTEWSLVILSTRFAWCVLHMQTCVGFHVVVELLRSSNNRSWESTCRLASFCKWWGSPLKTSKLENSSMQPLWWYCPALSHVNICSASNTRLLIRKCTADQLATPCYLSLITNFGNLNRHMYACKQWCIHQWYLP